MDREQAANELARRGVTLEDMKNYFLTVAEPVAAMGSGIVAEPLAGFAGLAAAPFGSDAAANAVNYYRDKLTYSPRSEAGQSGMAAVGEAMAPIGEAMDYAASGAGDYIYDKTGSPALAAAAYSAPTAALELLGLKGVNQLSKSGKLGQPLEFGDIGSGGVGNKQRGIFAGVKAKGADLKRQAAAEELANRGIGRDQIWQETGWFNDVDGSWKFEIDDSNSTVSDDARLGLKSQRGKKGTSQGDLLQHEGLYQNYPDTAGIPIDKKLDQSMQAAYFPEDDRIAITKKLVASGGDPLRDANLHELQHAIQEREGFAVGGNPGSVDTPREAFDRQARINDVSRMANNIDTADGNVAQAKEWAEYDKFYRTEEQWQEVADLGGWDEVKRLRDEPYQKYQRLAGEAEARNVQTRMDYTPEQRQAAAPWTTLDVPESELIVRGNSKGPMMSVSKAQAIEELEKRGIPMDYDSRMARAKEQGFSDDMAYRGIYGEYNPDKSGNYQMFTSSPEDAGEYGNNVIQARLKKGNNLAVNGAGNNFNSIPVDQLPNEVRANLHPSVGDVARTDDISYAAQKAGYDSVTFNNVYDNASGEIPLKPKPKKEGPLSDDLLALLDEFDASGLSDSIPDVALPPEIPKNYDPVNVDVVFNPNQVRSTNAAFDPADIGKSGLLKSLGGVGLGYQFLSGEDEQNQF